MNLSEEVRRTLESSSYYVAESKDRLVFESDSVLGFVKLAATIEELVASWKDWEASFLRSEASRIGHAGLKAWNVYSVFLVADANAEDSLSRLATIEEDFHSTRKIARANLISSDDVRQALYPLLPLQNSIGLGTEQPTERLRAHLGQHFPQSFLDLVLESPLSAKASEVLDQLIQNIRGSVE